MSSMEMVEFINADRKARATAEKPYVELRHESLMTKARKVLGEGVQKFLGTYQHPQNGQTYDCCYFPKREACLMAMSYSYELQARVWDRMVELEAELALQQLSTYRDRLPLHQAALEMVGRHGILFSTAHTANNALAGSKHYNEMTKSQVVKALPAAQRLASGTATPEDFALLEDRTRERFGEPAQLEMAFDRTSLITKRS
ncbi:hypothetical protein [Duganella callida]|uniref:Uncharacterized protein n=1 Tax=Duganella callida TaxID=2561932 RepID=A0A4Y9S7B1_9BURK|nr:hypothetical protein [Duganella callida]TFW15927.1 hypothetical protein E4L98_24845 [Duganella callida]